MYMHVHKVLKPPKHRRAFGTVPLVGILFMCVRNVLQLVLKGLSDVVKCSEGLRNVMKCHTFLARHRPIKIKNYCFI